MATEPSDKDSRSAKEHSPLIGNWKLVSIQNIFDYGLPQEMYGARPKGILILTRDGRMASIVTAENRRAGTACADRAELHESMIAYSGKYDVVGNEFVTTVDISWNEIWNGGDQRRYWRIVDGRLLIETAPQPSPNFPGRVVTARIV